mmetsp:Transcript_57921/g.149027  ORF Transcript_57921/g.149027 Transcript_57921/m.149027 type:complete len:312 (-) Transcript_57921:359-1294(-)
MCLRHFALTRPIAGLAGSSCSAWTSTVEDALGALDLVQGGATEADGPGAAGARDLARVVAEVGEAVRVARGVVEEVHLAGWDVRALLPREPVDDALGTLRLHRVTAADHKRGRDGVGAAPHVARQAARRQRLRDDLLHRRAARAARGDYAQQAAAAEGAGQVLAQRRQRERATSEGSVLNAGHDLVARALLRQALLAGQRPVDVEEAQAGGLSRGGRGRGRGRGHPSELPEGPRTSGLQGLHLAVEAVIDEGVEERRVLLRQQLHRLLRSEAPHDGGGRVDLAPAVAHHLLDHLRVRGEALRLVRLDHLRG